VVQNQKMKSEDLKDFCKGDLVAVFGGFSDKNGGSINQVTICSVEEIGQEDLIVKELSTKSFKYSTHETVSKKICKVLESSGAVFENSQPLVPKIGDLVLSYDSSPISGKEINKTTGILYKINYKLGKPGTCVILSGSEMIDVQYKNLIVIQKK